MDRGGLWTEMYISRMEVRIKEVYAEAEKDIEAKMQDFLEKYKAKEAIHLQELKDGKITQEQFDSWKQGQIFQGKQWRAKKEQIAGVLHDSNNIAAKIANEQKANVFAANANYQAYTLEHGAGIDFGFGIYDSATVVNLIKNQPQVLPFYTPKKGKDMTWNMQNITRQVTQGIIQGESLDKIAKRIARETGSRNMNSMLTNARTGMTMAQNAGRQMRLKEAQDKGLKVHKEWMATMDAHTRWQHADLDGQKKKLDEPFEIGGYSIMYPGDPMAHPSLVFNCRCTLVGDLDDYPSKYERYDNIEGRPVKEMTYREWEKAKGKSYAPSPATKSAKTFTQVSIGAARSVDEVNKLLGIPGLFRRGKPDLTGCDLDSAKSIASSYERVFAKFPQLKGKIDAPDAHPIGMGDNTYAWCTINHGGKVQVNPKHYGNWSKVVRMYEHDVSTRWHPIGTTAEAVVDHEIGHAVDGLLAREGILGGITSSGEYRYASSSLKTKIMDRAAKLDPEGVGRWYRKGKGYEGNREFTISQNVSRYAAQDPQEWFAECFAEYLTSANPRIVATEFGKELEKLLGRLK